MNNKDLMSLVEIAIEIQSENPERRTFNELYDMVCQEKGFTAEEKRSHIAQFYTDITACGDFIYCGDDLWDLKRNQKLEALEKEFQTEHAGFEEEEEEKQRPKPRRKSSKRAKSPLELEEEENREEIESEDQAYETQMAYDDEDYDSQDEDEDYNSYERDFDSELDEDDDTDYDEDDFDEDKYNSIMDEYENQYDD